MIMLIFSILYTTQLIVQHCNGLQFIDLPQGPEAYYRPKRKLESRAQAMYEPYPRIKGKKLHLRRHWQGNDRPNNKVNFKSPRRVYEDEKDATLKNKIALLVQQTMNEAEEKMKKVAIIKQEYREKKDYRAGFIISMVKKSREVLNELFNVAVKHRDEWLALEQLKIFELIIHTNIDTTNFLKQLVDIEEGRDTFEIPDSFKISKPSANDNPPSDPKNLPSDPNNPPPDPNNPPSDPNSPPADPNNPPPDPNNPPSDPNSPPADPNNPPPDPNDTHSDPNSPPADPNNPPSDPNSLSDPNNPPPGPNNPPADLHPFPDPKYNPKRHRF